MRRRPAAPLVATAIAIALGALACAVNRSGTMDLDGPVTADGSVNGSGGAAAGESASGGAVGSGGTASGGAAATGGRPGSGGVRGSGGSPGSGGGRGSGSNFGGTPGSGGQGGVAAASGGRGGLAGGGGAGGTPGVTGQGGGGTAGGPGGGGTPAGGAAGTAGRGGGFRPCRSGPAAMCAILPLGDSITEGWLPAGGMGGYRVQLFGRALKDGKNITFVGSQTSLTAPPAVQNRPFPRSHEGHDGFTIDGGSGTSGIAGNITDRAMSSYRPDIVLLMIGTNDVNGNVDVSNAPRRLGDLIDEIVEDSPDALVVVASIIPIASGNNAKAVTYNAAIPGLVDARAAAGKHVVFVDNYAAFIRDPGYQTSLMSNYLHPNTAGYAVLGDSFYDAISAFLP